MNRPDRTVFVVPALAFLIALWGVLTITASQYETARPLLLAGKQLVFVLTGMAVMLAAARIPFSVHLQLRMVYAVPALLFLLFLPLAGVRINGMLGWYSIGGWFFQPSELGKGIWLLLIAASGLRWRPITLWSALWIVPILLQPDFGTAAVYIAGLLCVWYSGGGRWKALGAACVLAVAAACVFVRYNAYAWRRLTAFWDPESSPRGAGWHILQFQMAVAHGGWTGSKLGQAFWSSEYLPLAYNDSAYAAMAETLGFLGCAAVLTMYAMLYAALIRQALRRDLDEAARRYLAGAASLLAVQTLLHAGVNTGLLPPTGLTLPLVSYGGSSLIGVSLMLGIAVSAARERAG